MAVKAEAPVSTGRKTAVRVAPAATAWVPPSVRRNSSACKLQRLQRRWPTVQRRMWALWLPQPVPQTGHSRRPLDAPQRWCWHRHPEPWRRSVNSPLGLLHRRRLHPTPSPPAQRPYRQLRNGCMHCGLAPRPWLQPPPTRTRDPTHPVRPSARLHPLWASLVLAAALHGRQRCTPAPVDTHTHRHRPSRMPMGPQPPRARAPLCRLVRRCDHGRHRRQRWPMATRSWPSTRRRMGSEVQVGRPPLAAPPFLQSLSHEAAACSPVLRTSCPPQRRCCHRLLVRPSVSRCSRTRRPYDRSLAWQTRKPRARSSDHASRCRRRRWPAVPPLHGLRLPHRRLHRHRRRCQRRHLRLMTEIHVVSTATPRAVTRATSSATLLWLTLEARRSP